MKAKLRRLARVFSARTQTDEHKDSDQNLEPFSAYEKLVLSLLFNFHRKHILLKLIMKTYPQKSMRKT